jgi:hypothetical protein
MPLAEQPLDDPSVRRVVEQGRRTAVEGETRVPADHDGRAGANPRTDRRIAGLHPRNDRTRHADRRCDGGLRDARTLPQGAKLVAEPRGIPAELTVALVDRPAEQPLPLLAYPARPFSADRSSVFVDSAACVGPDDCVVVPASA